LRGALTGVALQEQVDGRPEVFDFASNAYFEELYGFGEKLSTMKELRLQFALGYDRREFEIAT